MESFMTSKAKGPPPGYTEDTVVIKLTAWNGTAAELQGSFQGTKWIVKQVTVYIDSTNDARLKTQINLHRTNSTPAAANRIMSLLYGGVTFDEYEDRNEGSSTKIQAVGTNTTASDTYLTVKYYWA